MRFKAVMDSDGLIKLTKAGVLDVVVSAWDALVPHAVYAETVEAGIRGAYPDALVIRDTLQARMVHRPRHHPRATALLRGRSGLGRGEQEALHLFFAGGADTIITDDAAFVSMLARADVPYLVPALALVALVTQGHLDRRMALAALQKMRIFIRPEVYAAAGADLDALGGMH